ncbi:Uncharacterized protein TCM_044513 [Theobroma cacao]|uniref:Uncharacterized protein n=1 Tax=Theobroma cacao TaxID=3641 RepID=A0A061FR82_THECC|nr:Uncharacterized protein TCM_044513 [Theobroma cacao]
MKHAFNGTPLNLGRFMVKRMRRACIKDKINLPYGNIITSLVQKKGIWCSKYETDKQYKKDIAQEPVKKRRPATQKPYSRSIVGATLEVIQKRSEKPKVRDAAREATLPRKGSRKLRMKRRLRKQK